MYRRTMPMHDQHLGPNPPPAANAARDYGEAAVSQVLPIGKKRIMFRFWLAAIIVGGAIWAGIAYGLGLI